jgi:hypothetical protein
MRRVQLRAPRLTILVTQNLRINIAQTPPGSQRKPAVDRTLRDDANLCEGQQVILASTATMDAERKADAKRDSELPAIRKVFKAGWSTLTHDRPPAGADRSSTGHGRAVSGWPSLIAFTALSRKNALIEPTSRT